MEVEHAPRVGSVLAERYRLDELYREGGMSRVFVARDLLLDRDVAVKIMDGIVDDVSTGRVLRAGRLASRVDDLHVIRVLDVHPGPPPFLALELHRTAPLDIRDAAPRFAIADDLLSALGALHAEGVVHRDVRAENVLPTDQGLTFLTTAGMAEAARDSGLGRSPDSAEVRPPRQRAAPSPEQQQGLPADARSDVYAAGMLLEDLIGDHAGPAVVAVLGKATAEDPGDRFPDASALRSALHDARDADSTVPVPAPVPRAERLPLMRGRPRIRAGVLAGIAAVLAGLSVAAALGLSRGETSSATAPPPAPSPGVPASVAPPPSPAPGAEVIAAAGSGTALDELLSSPDLQGANAAENDLIRRLQEVNGAEGAERSAGVLELLGDTVTRSSGRTISVDLARAVVDALADEVTVEGLVAFARDDPAALGPDGPGFLAQLEELDGLSGDQRGRVAVELYGWAADEGGEDGRLVPSFAASAMTALLPELSPQGLILLAEQDPAAAGPTSETFAQQLRAFVPLQGDERADAAVRLYRLAAADGLSPRYAAAASTVLLKELTLDGLVVLAEDADASGPDAPGFAGRLRDLDDLQGDERAAAAMTLLADVDTSRDRDGVTAEFMIAAVQVLRRETVPPLTAGS